MIELYCEDCHIGLKLIQDKSVQVILVDPPYGTTPYEWDKVLDFNILWEQYKRILKDNGVILIFGHEPFSSFVRLSNLEWYKYDWYWQKERLTNVMQIKNRPGKVIETISVFYKNQCKYFPQKTKHQGKKVSNKIKDGKFSISITGDNSKLSPTEYIDDGTRYPIQLLNYNRENMNTLLHPTQKPVELIKYLIETYSEKKDIIVDHCMGSGTTGIACKELDRYFLGWEKDKIIFQTAKDRIEQHTFSKCIF